MTQFNVYIPGTTMFAHSSCCLHIPLAHPCLYYYLLSPQYTVLHILFHCTFYPLFFFLFLFYYYLYLYIFSCVMFHLYFYFFLHCPLSGPVLIYISLLIISCIIEYVTNKITLNLETLAHFHYAYIGTYCCVFIMLLQKRIAAVQNSNIWRLYIKVNDLSCWKYALHQTRP